jgi:3-oxoacyl-[acyl-carrier-protein] synthase III
MHADIIAIEYFLPEKTLTNKELEMIYDDWSASKIEKKTGIRERHIAATDETALDMGFQAAIKLFESEVIKPEAIDFILFCSESPDYPLPPCSCILQDWLKIPDTAGALDFNLACSGFVYGLGLAQGLIASGQAANILLITSETYSKYIHPDDRGVRTIFGDGAAATLIRQGPEQRVGPFIHGTDGSGFDKLIVATGGARLKGHGTYKALASRTDYPDHLFMNGPEIFNFTIKAVPRAINQLLDKAGISLDNVDYFIFHQANKYMLDHLRQKIGIPRDKFYSDILETGNTVSASIPIALKKSSEQGLIKKNQLVLLIGFGVGYSWSATLYRNSL